MPIVEHEGQTVVSFTGDILVLGFGPEQVPCDGTAWCLLQERQEGAIGRPVDPKEVDTEMCIQEQPGVLLAARDYRSLDILIDTLVNLRDSLKEIHEDKSENT